MGLSLRLSNRQSLCLVIPWMFATSAIAAPRLDGPELDKRHKGHRGPAGVEQPALGQRLTQDMVEAMSQLELRREGMRIFSTPFNKLDGLGDGPMDPSDTVEPGGRPTLQNNGLFLRINGMDSQTCLECHGILSNDTIPATFGVGGVGGIGANAMPEIIDPDIDDTDGNGFAAITGRFINPPFSFGSGGVELLGKEMTAELHALRDEAQANPGTVVPLEAKGIPFGSLVYENGEFDLSGVEGVEDDLIIKPFGRKGCCDTIREFDLRALQFHQGMQPIEKFGADVDADGDGVSNEILVGELSAMHTFQVSLERPRNMRLNAAARQGRARFQAIGCADCHIPSMFTESRFLDLEDPDGNVYHSIDLSAFPTGFRRSRAGVKVDLYADLKLHDMGPGLAESTGSDKDPFFTTARLWGVADTAPYLHDGRAPTLTEAILLHGGEAQDARDAFADLSPSAQGQIIEFLRHLRTPRNPNQDL